MSNPFHKYLGPDDHLQHQVITWLRYQHPKLRYHHSPNEGRRTPFEQFKFKYLGSDVWSRRLTQDHRCVYVVKTEQIAFLQGRYHY